MSWKPISSTVPQYHTAGSPASGYFLKFYEAGTTTAVNMATDSGGGTTLAKCQINAEGYPINGSSAVFIPHIGIGKYKLALYLNATDADNNTTGSAAWVVDNITTDLPNTTSYELGSVASGLSHNGISTGHVISTNYYDTARTADSGGLFRYTGTTDAADASNWPHTDGFFYDADGKQFAAVFPLNAKAFGATGDGTTDDAAALEAAFTGAADRTIHLPKGVYSVASTIDITEPLTIEGEGHYFKDDGEDRGTIIKAASSALVDVIDIVTTDTNERQPKFKNFGVRHLGSGTGITIDNFIGSILEDVDVLCDSSGATGIKYLQSGYFARLVRPRVRNFTTAGIVIDGTGFDHQLENPFVSSTTASAIGVHVKRQQFKISGGQIDVTSGTGIKLDAGGSLAEGGIIEGVAFEATSSTGIEITANAGFTFRYVTIDAPFFALDTGSGGVTTGIKFDRAYSCVMRNPAVPTPSSVTGTLAEWTANAVDCGIVVDSTIAQCPLTVDASATGAYMRVEGDVPNLANVTTDANLKVYVERSNGLYNLVHNGTAWNKGTVTLADDAATSIAVPKTAGTLEITCPGRKTVHAVIGYAADGTSEMYVNGSDTELTATDGTLGGTTGTDVKFTIRANSSALIYLENRMGASTTIEYHFKDPSE